MKTFWSVPIAAGFILAAFWCGRATKSCPIPGVLTDTLIMRDTLRETVPVPGLVYVVRVDTVFLEVPGDTVRVEVAVPVERKVYLTDDYRAVVEGFRPSLVEMDVYRRTVRITRDMLPGGTPSGSPRPDRRWGIGLQAGWGFSPEGGAPYVGVGVQYSILTW